jgi:hypothetical protein
MEADGEMTRYTTTGMQTADTLVYAYCIGVDGAILRPDRCLADTDGSWVYVWNDLQIGSLVFRVAMFRECGGYWEPVFFPSPTDEQKTTLAALLRLHGVEVAAGLGLKKAARRGW